MNYLTMSRAVTILGLLAAAVGGGCAAPPKPDSVQSQGWPRTHVKGDQQVVVYQPQLDEWVDYQRLQMRMAVAVSPGKGQAPEFGVATVKASTAIDHEKRTVLIQQPVIDMRFPNVEAKKAASLEKIAREVLPDRQSITVPLERAMAYVDKSAGGQSEVQVNLDPPPIFYSDKPAVLVIFIGAPEFKPIPSTSLMAAVNTNWDIVLDTAISRYYLLYEGSWLSTSDPLKGPWTPTVAPGQLKSLPDDENWKEMRQAYPGRVLQDVPKVFASAQPAELILTAGEPRYRPIPGTGLMQVSNTESALFFLPNERNHYYLVAGRWFRAKHLSGPWSAATRDLPADFAKIPPDDQAAYVLASVPGTEDAEDAVVLASIPQTATIQRNDTTVIVTYEGDPKFVAIEGTQVRYAVNTPCQVLLAEGKYYCCYQGVWFVSGSPVGPWAVCAVVPQAIYTIPPSSPLHNVTYVYVYESTPTTVNVGYTAGYTGQYVAAGVLMFGTGMAIGAAIAHNSDDYWNSQYHWSSHWYSYGCGAVYRPASGGYYRAGAVYGPYGGAGRAAYYNPNTGAWARGAYRYGPAGGAYAKAGYNPYTNTAGARAGGSNVYGSWGRSYVQRGDDWARAGHQSGARGSVGWVGTSGGSGAVAVDTVRGNTVVAKGPNDNVYVGHDGNVYRRDDSGDWQKRQGGGWQNTDVQRTPQLPSSVNREPAAEAANRVSPQIQNRQPDASRSPGNTAPSRSPGRDVTASSRYSQDVATRLHRDSSARQRGDRSAARSQRSFSGGGRRR